MELNYMSRKLRIVENNNNESGKTFVNTKDPRCPVCNDKLRMVTFPIKQKCDSCGMVYTINPHTGEIVNKFRSFVKAK